MPRTRPAGWRALLPPLVAVLLPSLLSGAPGADPVSRIGERWRWRIFDRDEGVSPGAITALYRNVDDYMYAASERGLCRYDLHHWEIIENSEPFDDGPVLRVVESQTGVYCASRHVLWAVRGGTELRRVWKGRGGASGRIFVAASRRGEVYLIDGAEHYAVRDGVDSLGSGEAVPLRVRDYRIDHDGVHWLATEFGLRYRDLGEHRRWIEYRDRDLPFPGATCDGFLLMDIPPQTPLPRARRFPDRELWGVFRVGEGGGEESWHLARLVGRSWVPLRSSEGPVRLEARPEAIAADTLGNRWLTAENGRLWCLRGAGSEDGARGELVRIAEPGVGPVKLHGVLLDSRGGLWFRLAAGGVAFVNLRAERWRRLPALGAPPQPRVLSLLESSAGELWVGTEDGVLVYPVSPDGRPGTPRAVEPHLDTPLRDVTALAEEYRGREGPGRVWVGSETFAGVFVLDRAARGTDGGGPAAGRWDRVELSEPIHRIVRDPRGELWLLPGALPGERPRAASPRVYRSSVRTGFEPRPVRVTSALPGFRPERLPVNDLVRTPGDPDLFWLATEDGLLSAKLEGSDTLAVDLRLTEEDGLVSTRVWAVEAGPDGAIWVCYPSSGRGVTRVHGPSVRHFDVEDGLAGPGVWSVTRSGRDLWFGTDSGLSRFDGEIWYGFPIAAQDPRSSRVIPVLVPGETRLRGTVVAGTADQGTYVFESDDRRRPRLRKLEFPARVEEGEPAVFRWRARDYKNRTPPEQLIYRWRLDGGSWTQKSGIDSLRYEDLGLGQHVLELEVRDLDGNRNRDYDERIHEFAVVPPAAFWPRAVAGGLAVLLVAALAVVRLRSRWRQRDVFERYRGLFLGLPRPVLIVDRERRIRDYNGVAPELLGLGPGEIRDVLGRPARMVPVLATASIDAVVERALAGESVRRRVSFAPSSDPDALREFEVSADPLRAKDDGGGAGARRIHGAAVQVDDITRRREAERLEARDRRLAGFRDFAERLGRDIDRALEDAAAPERLPAGLDHELREALRSGRDRLEALTGSLAEFSRTSDTARRPVDIAELLEGLLGGRGEDAATPGALRLEPGVHVDWRAQTGLWPARGDTGLLESVLASVLQNALDALDGRGHLTVRATNTRIEEDPGHLPEGSYVEVVVRDDGPGMDERQVEAVFDPFWSTKPRDRARGLGLSLAWCLLRATGGDIRIRSRPGGGTTVTLIVPASR